MRHPLPALTATTAAAAAAWLAAALSTTAAHADPDHLEVSFGAAARALRSPSANALTGSNLDGAAFGLARDIGRDLAIDSLHDLSLWAEAGLVSSSATGTMFQSLSTSIDGLAITAGLGARYRLHRLLGVNLHAGVGAQRARVAITEGPATAYDHAWGVLAEGSAAVDIFAVRRPFGLGLRLEAGYALAQGIALTPHTDHPDDTRPLAMVSASLGRLDLSGPSAALSAFGQF
jgi:hypothetical protein